MRKRKEKIGRRKKKISAIFMMASAGFCLLMLSLSGCAKQKPDRNVVFVEPIEPECNRVVDDLIADLRQPSLEETTYLLECIELYRISFK